MAKKKPSKLDIDLSGLQQTLKAQFTGLDPNDPTQWPSVPRYLLLTFIAAAVVAGLWFAWLSSFQEELEAERALLADWPQLQHDYAGDELVVPDFLRINEQRDDLVGYDACLYCAGAPPVGTAEAEYRRVTLDTTLAVARAWAAACAASPGVASTTEPMRRDIHLDGDDVYRLGFVIEHNASGRANAGSCIFAHLWRTPGEPTAGCTAMAADTMDDVLAWLRPDARPVFVLLPRTEYVRLAREWQLPGAAR